MIRRPIVLGALLSLFACGGDPRDSDDLDGGSSHDTGTRADASTRSASDASGGAGGGATSSTGGTIETVITVTRYGIGVGGFTTIEFAPVVLFKGGLACSDISVLKPGVDLAQHRASKPKAWTRWQPAPRGGYQQYNEKSGTWSSFGSGAEYGPLPRGFKLDGVYASIKGGGSVAFGGSTVGAAVRQYTFRSDLTFVRGGAASISSSGAVAGSSTADQRGTYLIDGYVLTLKLASGTTETHSIVGHVDVTGLIYIDGVDFVTGDD